MTRQFDEAYVRKHQAKHSRNSWAGIKVKSVAFPELPPMAAETKPVKAEKKAKFGNIKTADAHSLKESRRMNTLRVMQTAGVISNLAFQVRYQLVPKQLLADGSHERAMTYTCDAQYIENGKLVVEDTKSEVTRKLPRYIAARKLMLLLYGIEIREV